MTTSPRIHAKAAATGLSGVTVRDFLHNGATAGGEGEHVAPLDLRIIALKRFKSLLRQMILRLLG